MINGGQGLKIETCYKHNQPIIAYNQAQPFCQTCFVEQAGAVSVEEILLKENQGHHQQHQLLQSLRDSLVNYKNEMINQLDQIIQVIQEQIKQIDASSEQFQKMIDQTQNKQTLISELQRKLDNKQETYKSVRSLIENLLQAFNKKFNNINSIQFKKGQVLDKQNATKKINRDLVVNVEKQKNSVLYQYELIEKSTKKENSICFAFDFNKDKSILAVARYEFIKIYEFINGQLKEELQRLHNNQQQIYCLCFMKRSNCLVSGSGDGPIIIWNLDKNNKWFAQQKLKAHQNSVLCIMMNKIEDLLISGGWDKNIIFWRIQNGKWQCNQTINMNYYVYALSLNESQNRLISCGWSSQISIMEQQQNDLKWIIIQTIDVIEQGYRLCFTIGNQFVFQPATLNYLEVYDYDQINNKFQKLQQIEVQSCNKCNWLFPCQYIKQINVLTVRHGGFINIFQVNQDGYYKIIQTIKYEEQESYGCLSDDGQYLIIWDKISQETQVRELRQIL